MNLKCNQCGIADAGVTHVCPPLGGSTMAAWPASTGFTLSPSNCYRCGKPAIGHWSPIPNITAAAPMMPGPYPLCSEHMAETFGYATKAALDEANAKIERLHEGIRRAARGKCSRPGCDNSVPVSPPWCSVACMDEHVRALPPAQPLAPWTCTCGYMNTAVVCTKCGGAQ